VGVGALHRVTEVDNDPDVREVAGQPLGSERVEQVVGACLANDGRTQGGPRNVTAADLERKVRAIPAQTAGVVRVVVVDAFDVLAPGEELLDGGMLKQVVIQ
jgi:hypothetical protein